MNRCGARRGAFVLEQSAGMLLDSALRAAIVFPKFRGFSLAQGVRITLTPSNLFSVQQAFCLELLQALCGGCLSGTGEKSGEVYGTSLVSRSLGLRAGLRRFTEAQKEQSDLEE